MEKTYKKWIALIAMSLGTFMGLLDVTVVNVALPTMAEHFNETFTNLQWVLNIYTLVLAVSLLILSKMGDMYGRRKIFIVSIVLFIIASAVNGMAPNLTVLILSRALQAIGGAGMSSLAMALVASNFSGKQRGFALGILGSVIGVSTASGPLIGGYLVAVFGWSSIFYVNIPVGIITVVLTVMYVKETPSYGAQQRIDFAGMLISAATLFCLIYGLILKEGHSEWEWTSPYVESWLIASLLFLVLFIVVEHKIKDPMIDLSMLKDLHMIGALIVALALGIAMYAFSAFLTVLMQNYMGYSALGTGIRQLVMSLWSLILGPVTGLLANRFKMNRLIGFSLFLGGVGFLLFMNAMTLQLSFNQIWPALILMGIANGLVNPLLNTAGMEGIAPQAMGMASGLINVFRQIGTTIGVVGLGLIQADKYEEYLDAHLVQIPEVPQNILGQIHRALVEAGPFAGHDIAFAGSRGKISGIQSIQTVVLGAYSDSMKAITFTSAVVLFIAGCAALVFMRSRIEMVEVKV